MSDSMTKIDHARRLDDLEYRTLYNAPSLELWIDVHRALVASRIGRLSDVESCAGAKFILAIHSGAWLEAVAIMRPPGWYWRMDEMDRHDHVGDFRAQLICRRNTHSGLSMGSQAPAGPYAEARARISVILRCAARMLREGMPWTPGMPL